MPTVFASPRTWNMSLLSLRLALRLSLRQAARVADMSHMQVHLLERGEGTPDARRRLLLAYRQLALHYEHLYARLAGTCDDMLAGKPKS